MDVEAHKDNNKAKRSAKRRSAVGGKIGKRRGTWREKKKKGI